MFQNLRNLERTLSDYNLSIDGTVPNLRKRLSQHLMQLEARVTKNMLQTNVPLSKPAAICVASDHLLVCADDGHRVVYQIQLEWNGVTINGKLRKPIAYPEGIHHLESLQNLILQLLTSLQQKVPIVTVSCTVLT